jgi:hypothetical protein
MNSLTPFNRFNFLNYAVLKPVLASFVLLLTFCLLAFPKFLFAGTNQDWSIYSSDGDCLLMTTEKKRGNLGYPSTLFLFYDKSENSLGAAIQNFEWLLTERKSSVSFVTNRGSQLQYNVNLSDNLMSISDRAFITEIESDFKRDTFVRLNNSKGRKVSEFSLMGFTKSYEVFKQCVISSKPKVRNYTSKVKKNNKSNEINASIKETLGFFIKAAVLFAIANGDLAAPSMAGSNFDITVPDLVGPNAVYRSDRNTDYRGSSTNDAPKIIGGASGTSYRTIGNTVRSSGGETWRRIGGTVRSSSGTTYRQVGNTTRSSDGESWRQVGDTIRSSSGVTWRRVGNTIRSSDGVTCRNIGVTTRCN